MTYSNIHLGGSAVAAAYPATLPQAAGVERAKTARECDAALQSRVVAVPDLLPETRQAMWRLFSQYYVEVSRDAFLKDLEAKHHVILIRERTGRMLQGFSTLQTYKREVMGRRFGVIFSGDTVVAREYWGQSRLQRAFLRYIVNYKLQNPFIPVYWFLISKGYKTYMLMSRNYPEYWPRHEKPTPPWEAAVIDQLATEKFGEAWKPERGVLEFERCPCRLKIGVAPINEELRERYPEVRFFEQKNPGHAKGDELCCIGLINPQLWIHYLGKLAKKKLAKRLASNGAR